MQQNLSPENELLECFDEEGNVIASKTRRELHTKPYRTWHGVTVVWLMNSKGQILCTRRSENNEGNPGKWQTYLGGHIKAGQDFLENAQTELLEEIGLQLPQAEFKLVTSGKREDFMHVYKMYAVLFQGELSSLNFTDGEVVEAKWFTFDEYQKDRTSNTDNWCNNITSELHAKALEMLGVKINEK